MVSVVIPAFNEEKTIAETITAIIGHPYISEVIVVDDGSSDSTAEQAAKVGATVIVLAKNSGKGTALDVGVHTARGTIILFLDADVIGITHENISRIIDPIIKGQYSMFVGVLARRTAFLNRLLKYFPIIGGERAILKSLWFTIPPKYLTDFKVEIALNYFSKQAQLGMSYMLINGPHHIKKETKYGVARGLIRRVSMVRDIVSITFSLYIVDYSKRLIRKWYSILEVKSY
jgi:glycosyltransferase involved in cell wall biosynthesis